MNKFFRISFLYIFLTLLLAGNSTAQTGWYELGSVNSLKANSFIRSIIKDNAGNIYTAGQFTNDSGYYPVMKWNGTSWSELKNSGLPLNKRGYINVLLIDPAGNIYAAGQFSEPTGNNRYVAKWDGSNWTELGTGSAALNANNDITCLAIDGAGNLYAAGWFTNASGSHYVAKWNGTAWSELGSGINALNANDWIYGLTADSLGNIYASGDFKDANNFRYVAKWNGTSWTETGTLNANNTIYKLTTDVTGTSIYAVGSFENSTGYPYVAKWDGNQWSQVGTGSKQLVTAFGACINSITTDKAGNIFIGGTFTNQSGNEYVAK